MKTVELETWVEIPVTVVVTKIEAEGDGWNEPYTPEHMGIYSVTVQKNIESYIEREYHDSLIDEARGLFDE